MAIRARCSSCGAEYRLADEAVGRKARCKGCGEVFRVQPLAVVAARTESDPLAGLASMEQAAEAVHEPREPVVTSAVAAPAAPAVAVAYARPQRKRSASKDVLGFEITTGRLMLGLTMALGLTLGLSLIRPGLAPMVGAVIGLILSMVGGIWSLLVAFRESVTCGLLYLLLPFYSIYYLFTRWEEMHRPFLVGLAGTAFVHISAAVG